MILADANIWIYLMDRRVPEHALAMERVPPRFEGEEILMPALVELEVLHYARRRMGAQADEAFEEFVQFPATMRPLDHMAVSMAAGFLKQLPASPIGGRDAALLHYARTSKARLFTHDGPLLRAAAVLEIPAEDPLAAPAADRV